VSNKTKMPKQDNQQILTKLIPCMAVVIVIVW